MRVKVERNQAAGRSVSRSVVSGLVFQTLTQTVISPEAQDLKTATGSTHFRHVGLSVFPFGSFVSDSGIKS